MSHVLPFEIDGYTFTHTVTDSALNTESRAEMSKGKNAAMGVWRTEGWGQCLAGQVDVTFAVQDDQGNYFGSWMLYRVRPVGTDPNVVSALLAPMFSDLDARVISEARAPGGEVINADEVAASEARSAVFWRRVFSIVEWQIINPMPMEGGGDFVLDHLRFPQTSDDDPVEQCWVGLEPVFNSYSKLDAEWNDDMPEGFGRCPVRTLDWKATDPDPGRARGSVNL